MAVTDDSLSQAIHDIRRALGDDARLLRTLSRRGFLLAIEGASAPSGPPTTGRPRIAVLPLSNETRDPGLAPLLDGFAEEVTGGLSRFRNLTVLARHSAFALAREGLPPRRSRRGWARTTSRTAPRGWPAGGCACPSR
jgi:hypothetical protein